MLRSPSGCTEQGAAAAPAMLAADKLLLQSQIKQTAVELREKELKLHYENFNAVGTQAAVLAGFAMTALAEVTVPPSCHTLPENSPLREYTNDSPQCTSIWLKGTFYILVLVCMAAQIHCVCNTTFITVWGAAELLCPLPAKVVTHPRARIMQVRDWPCVVRTDRWWKRVMEWLLNGSRSLCRLECESASAVHSRAASSPHVLSAAQWPRGIPL